MKRESADIAIVGGGIAGLAHAYMALRKGYRVVLFERNSPAVGASVRNFGLVWPLGQEPGKNLERALRSRQHWIEVGEQCGIDVKQNGSLQLAHHGDELGVLEEFESKYRHSGFDVQLLTPDQTLRHSPLIRKEGLKGGMISHTELTVNPRVAIAAITEFLQRTWGLILETGCIVREIAMPVVRSTKSEWSVSQVMICNGADFETLYPELFNSDIVACKLQMMRGKLRNGATLGPSLCAGLTLLHYKAFASCSGLAAVRDRYNNADPRFERYGIHVLVSQHFPGELVIGDSHQYGHPVSPFDSEEINELILSYLSSFVNISGLEIVDRWHGVYPKTWSDVCFLREPAPGVKVVTGLGGAGMTLSFGIAEEVIDSISN